MQGQQMVSEPFIVVAVSGWMMDSSSRPINVLSDESEAIAFAKNVAAQTPYADCDEYNQDDIGEIHSIAVFQMVKTGNELSPLKQQHVATYPIKDFSKVRLSSADVYRRYFNAEV